MKLFFKSLITALLLISICSCYACSDKPSASEPSSVTSETSESSEAPAAPTDEYFLPAATIIPTDISLCNVKDADIHTDLQENFLDESNYTTAIEYAVGKEEYSRPLPIRLEWKINERLDGSTYTVSLSENADMTEAYSFTTQNCYYDVYNLKIGTEYYWNVSASGVETVQSATNSFITDSHSIRNLYIDGITNARDIGGKPINENTRVKQGMIYRTARLNENGVSTPKNIITNKGISTMLDFLGIKTEIDIRKTENNEVGGLTDVGVLGESVNYYQCPMEYEGNIALTQAESVGNVFRYLADEDNYPVFYHCSIGTDRTGFLSYLILGLLGVNIDEIYTDYMFSNFGNIGGSRQASSLVTINESLYAGATLQQSIRSYLTTTCGVTETELNTIVSLMTEEIPENVKLRESKTHTITLDADGGELLKSSISVYENEEFTLPTPTKYGFIFDKWTLNTRDEPLDFASGLWVGEKDVTLVANWKVDDDFLTINYANNAKNTYCEGIGLPSLTLENGAFMKITSDYAKSQLGYRIVLKQSDYEKLFGESSSYKNVSFGILIALESESLYSVGAGGKKTFDYSKFTAYTVSQFTEYKNSQMGATAAIVGIPESDLDTLYRAIGYITYEMNGVQKTAYFGDEDNVCSLYTVAKKARADLSSYAAPKEQKQILKTLYIDPVSEK